MLPANGSLHGALLDRHLLLNLWIILGLAASAHLLLLAGLIARPNSGTTVKGRTRVFQLEFLPLAVFTLLFAWLAARAEHLWALSRYTGPEPAALQVEVTGMQFAWYFRYPGADATLGRVEPALLDPASGNPLGIDPGDLHGRDDIVSSELVLPAGRQVDLTLRALDVIHGFAIPEMRVKQNAVPGQVVHLHFTPTLPGTYAILCTQLCGLGHFRMNANLRVVAPAEFSIWLRTHPVRGTP